MYEFSFEAIGTRWSILTDGKTLSEEDKAALLSLIDCFDKQFSRFKEGSEAVQFREAKPGIYPISSELQQMLQVAKRLSSVTNGAYEPAVGSLLEHSGYDAEYTFQPDQQSIEEYTIPRWSIEDSKLSLQAGAVFDIGGIGKGFCIDAAAELLQKRGHKYFLVEAGGDMFGTSKANGEAFQIALEWPGKPGVAFGTLALHQEGLAVSDTFRRRWQDWHHIINPVTKKPIQNVLGCAAVAKNAFFADCMTSGLFLAPEENYEKLQKEFAGEFVVFFENENIRVSADWPGEFFGQDSLKEK